MQEEWQAEVFPSGLDGMHVTSMSYQLELDSVCLSLSSGSLVLVHAETHAVEEVGSIEGGISAMEWSPDGDVLAMVTGAGNLLVMSQEWEVLSEMALQAPLADRQEGSGGSGDDDDAYADARVSWRGDGKFFATGFRTASGSRLVSTPPRVSVGPTHPHMSGNMLGSAHPPCVFSFFMRFHRRMVCLPVRHPFCCWLTDVCACLWFFMYVAGASRSGIALRSRCTLWWSPSRRACRPPCAGSPMAATCLRRRPAAAAG